jgi:MscS family membrane protein
MFASAPGVPPVWVIRYLSPWLWTTSIYGVAAWQWIALPVAFLVSMLVGHLAVAVLSRAAGPIGRRALRRWDDELFTAFRRPAGILVGTLAFGALVPFIALRRNADEIVDSGVDALMLVGLFWAGVRTLDLFADRATKSITASRAADPDARGSALNLVNMGTKVGKVVLVVFGAAVILNQLGVQVGSIVAGLGIGGIAVALAAQKTIENFFGSVTLGVDRPLHIGDYVAVDGIQGKVERIGLRSTRLRTLDRTVITLPNGKLADMRIENYTARDRIRLFERMEIQYATKPATLRAILADMRAYLAERPGIFAEEIYVNLVSFGDAGFAVEVMAWYQTRAWEKFLPWREETLLGLLDIVDRHGANLAYPTHTLQIEGPLPTRPRA